MEERKKKTLRIVYALSIFLIVFGSVMQILHARANGIVGEVEGTHGDFASLAGWQIIIVGAILFLIALGSESKLRKNKNN